jgi:hypothetical protein
MGRKQFQRLFVIAWLLLLLLSRADADMTPHPGASLESLPSSTLIYVSDYFSFVGEDSQGHVSFALDNNRGRDGDAYQAEHFLVLHDERQSWVNLTGNGFFENTKQALSAIPDSLAFQFSGTPRTGMTVTSAPNHLTLKIEPIPLRTQNKHEGAVTWMGSAPAVLTWKERTLAGRVIYEYFMMPEFNRLTRTYWGMWKEFQGLYLMSDQSDDVYIHSQLSERIAPLIGRLSGFGAFNELTESMNDLIVEPLDREWTLGFYRWPTAWRITWTGPKGPAILTLRQSSRKALANWIIGGFSMGIVQGELEYAGNTRRVYGLAELIM